MEFLRHRGIVLGWCRRYRVAPDGFGRLAGRSTVAPFDIHLVMRFRTAHEARARPPSGRLGVGVAGRPLGITGVRIHREAVVYWMLS